MNPDIEARIKRIYHALGDLNSDDFSSVTFVRSMDTGLEIDFSGGKSDEQLSNIAHSAIHNVANLKDHFKKWARHNGKESKYVDTCVKNSGALQIIIDLSNNDKHGYPPRDKGYSGKAPYIKDIRRIMRVTHGPGRPSGSGFIISPRPGAKPTVIGNPETIIIAKVVDSEGNNLGDLDKYLTKGMDTWEACWEELQGDNNPA